LRKPRLEQAGFAAAQIAREQIHGNALVICANKFSRGNRKGHVTG
jgi:hypothetical protein